MVDDVCVRGGIQSKSSQQIRAHDTHFTLSYTAHNEKNSIKIPKGIVSEISKFIAKTPEIIASDDNIVVKMTRNKQNELAIIVAQLNKQNKPSMQLGCASFRGAEINMTLNSKHPWIAAQNNLHAFLSAACIHLMCRRQFFENLPHVFCHSINAKNLLDNIPSKLVHGVDGVLARQAKSDTKSFNVGIKYYKSFFHFNAKLINAALKTHISRNYTLDMARGLILNAAIAACSEDKDQSKHPLIFHSDTMSWVDNECSLVQKLRHPIAAILNNTHKPNMRLSLRMSSGIVKFPVYVLPKQTGAWALLAGAEGKLILMGHCENLVLDSGNDLRKNTAQDNFHKTIIKLRALHFNLNCREGPHEVVAPRQVWLSNVNAIIDTCDCTEKQKQHLHNVFKQNNPCINSMCLLG